MDIVRSKLPPCPLKIIVIWAAVWFSGVLRKIRSTSECWCKRKSPEIFRFQDLLWNIPRYSPLGYENATQNRRALHSLFHQDRFESCLHNNTTAIGYQKCGMYDKLIQFYSVILWSFSATALSNGKWRQLINAVCSRTITRCPQKFVHIKFIILSRRISVNTTLVPFPSQTIYHKSIETISPLSLECTPHIAEKIPCRFLK